MMHFQIDLHAMRIKAGGGDPSAHQHAMAQYKMSRAFFTHLLHPDVLQFSLDFMRLQAGWLGSLTRLPPDQAAAAFEQVPAFVVLDMCWWLKFVA
jgi:hypothetical protein